MRTMKYIPIIHVTLSTRPSQSNGSSFTVKVDILALPTDISTAISQSCYQIDDAAHEYCHIKAQWLQFTATHCTSLAGVA